MLNRDQVADMAFYAYTLDECLAAETAVTKWLREHPQDMEFYDLGSQLGIMTLAVEQERAHQQPAKKSTA